MITSHTSYQAIRKAPYKMVASARRSTVALLERSYEMLELATRRIAAQEERITALEALVVTDNETGLKNKKAFRADLAAELDRCKRGLSSGGLLVMIDMDNFAAINRDYGPLAGKSCLRLVARTLESGIRTMDVAARLSEDEFVLLLSNTTKCDAAARAQELAWQLNNLALAWHGEEIAIRASLGLKSYGKDDTVEKLVGTDIASMNTELNTQVRQQEGKTVSSQL